MQATINLVRWAIPFVCWMLTGLLASAVFGGELPEMEVRYVAATPEEAAWRDEFPLAVVEVKPTYDLTQAGEPAIECTLRYEIVHENHPDIDTFKADGGQDVYLGDRWYAQQTLEAMLRNNECPAYRHQN